MSTPVAVATQPASLWEDFLDIFYAPSQVFERRREGAGGAIWVPLAVLTLTLVALYIASQWALQPMFEAEFTRAMAANPNVDAAQMQAGRDAMMLFGTIAFAVFFPIGLALTALVAWGLARLVGSAVAFATTMMVVVYAAFPRALEMVVSILQGTFMSPDQLDSQHAVTLSLARFLDPDATQALLLTLARRVDLFTLWATALLALGLVVAGRMPKERAVLVAGLVWLLGALPAALGALISSGAFG